MVNDSEGSSKRIRVVDRRRFTEDGNPRGGESGVSPGPEPEGVPETGARPQSAEQPTAASAVTSEDFLELIAMLAQQAEIMMVGAEGLPAQPLQAKRLIDYLGAVEAKTEGNLSIEESKLLSDLVFQLRTMYLKANR